MITAKYIVQPRPLEDLPHHQMEKAKQAFQAYVYMDDSQVPEADVVVNIGEMDLHSPLEEYVDQHKHDVSSCYCVMGNLTIEVVLGKDRHEVNGPASVFIPPNMMHSVRPIQGKGILIVIQRSGKFE